ncbi:MAG: hypothetical protein JST00_19650 [Deltaproteobacteria bacterium]|nr:hypothetical protein [Deltaproteobacteria bacterium]
MRSLWLTGLASAVLFCSFGSAGCSQDPSGAGDEIIESEEPLTRVTPEEQTAARRQDISGFTFDHLTPTTTSIMRASHWWMGAQDESPRYPKARMCASNVSKVLFLAGLTSIDQEGVRALIADVRDRGGLVYKMPQTPDAFATTLATIDAGHLPAGTIVAGMNVATSAPGDQHIGFVGHHDPDGTVWIYHNNWYRPENENGQRKPFMVSEENLSRGFPRQWMATPWIKIERNTRGAITKVTSLLPAVDDMDPFNPSFRVTLAILPQVARELRGGR